MDYTAYPETTPSVVNIATSKVHDCYAHDTVKGFKSASKIAITHKCGNEASQEQIFNS